MKTLNLMRSAVACAALLGASAAADAALLGVSPAEPTLDFPASGIINYVASTGIVTISGVPATLFQTDPFILGSVLGTGVDDERLFTVQFKVDTAGNLVPGGIAGADLVVKGSVDTDFDSIPNYEGVLLEAEVIGFGFENGTAGLSDFFDLRLNAVGGALAPLYAGRDLAISVTSEPSTEYPNAFNGAFLADFVGQAKGVLGSIAPLVAESCKLQLEAFCSVDGGPFKQKCRIKATRSWHHWDWDDRVQHGRTYKRYTYGSHGDPTPSWANRFPGTNVTFKYILTNIGTTPVSAITVDDSFSSAVPGVPASLTAGQSSTMTRVENLRDTIENTVAASGSYGTAFCGATDTVIVKEKLRERRRHDYDDFKDKGDKDNDNYR